MLMQPKPVIWKWNKPERIRNKSHNYVVSFFFNSIEHKVLYAVVKDEDSKYRIIEVREGVITVMDDYIFDDVYINSQNRYYSRDRFGLEGSTELDGEQGLIQFCFVNKGVNGLLTCYPVWLNSSNIESGKLPFEFCPSFVCESFDNEYYYLNGCVYRHDMKTGQTGKGWYKEIHREFHFYAPVPSNRKVSCYQYERYINGSTGLWLVVDEDGSGEKMTIKGIEASNILFADFRDKNAILIGIEQEGQNYPKALLVFEHKDGPVLRESVECNRWDIYDMQEDTLIVLLIWQSIRLYSKKKGSLSQFIYDNDPFFGETLEGREFHLTPAGTVKDGRVDICRISSKGEITIEHNRPSSAD